MAKKIDDPIQAMRVEIERKFDIALASMAAEMTWRIESAYETVIQSFYDEYTPKYYRRTYSTYLASDKYNDPFGFTSIESGYESGIGVDHENIPGRPYRASRNWVFTRTFAEGIHGYFRREAMDWYKNYRRRHYMSKKKQARVKKFFAGMTNHAPKKYKGLSGATIKMSAAINTNQHRKDYQIGSSYSFDSSYWESFDNAEMQQVVLRTHSSGWGATTPKAMMDKTYKKLVDKKELKALSDKILTRYFS